VFLITVSQRFKYYNHLSAITFKGLGGSRGHGNEPSSFVKGEKYLDKLSVQLASQEELCFIELVNLYNKRGAAVVQAVSDYGLDDRGSIPDRGRGFFF
jgi:hypothetical protein